MEHQIFTQGDARYIYAFEELPFKHIMMIEEIYHFKRQQLERKPQRFEDVIASGGADFKCRAASLLLLPCDANGTVTTPDAKAARKFVDSMKGTDVEILEECLADFFTRRGKSDLESEVRSRVFLTLEDIAYTGLRMQERLEQESANANSPSSPSETPFTDQANSTGD